jgi:hypothetical protein
MFSSIIILSIRPHDINTDIEKKKKYNNFLIFIPVKTLITFQDVSYINFVIQMI